MAPLNILISYQFFEDQLPVLERLKSQGKVTSMFLDSGTFSDNPDGYNPGTSDKFATYLWWVKKIGRHFDYISSLDDWFHDPAHNRNNYEELLGELLQHDNDNGTQLASKLVPVIHSAEPHANPAEEFYEYIEAGAKTIGIGSTPQISDRAMESICELTDAFKVRVHMYGNYDMKYLAHFKVNSADSARYFRSREKGNGAWFWDSENNRPVLWNLDSPETMPVEFTDTLQNIFKWTVEDLRADAGNVWLLNIYSHQQLQAFITSTFAI